MFGTVKMDLNQVWFINHTLSAGYKGPEQKGDGTTVAVDISDSMKRRTTELKIVWSALNAMAGTRGQNELPALNGSTALVDAANEICKTLVPGQKFIIITDGDDTSSKTWPESPIVCGPGHPHADYHTAKRAALLDHLEKVCQADVFLIGMGLGAAAFVKTAAAPGRRTRAAYIADGATAAQVAGVLRATVKAPARAPDAAVAVIEIDSPEAQALQPDAEEAAQLAKSASAVVIIGSDARLSDAAFKQIFEDAEASLEVGTVDKVKARTAVMYWMNQILAKKEPLPGALLGGRAQHIFVDPAYPQQSGWHSYLNQLLSRLNKKLLHMNPKLTEQTKYDMEGREFTYSKVNTYSVLNSVSEAVVRAVKADAAWCAPESELKMLDHGKNGKGKKRKAEEQLIPGATEPAGAGSADA